MSTFYTDMADVADELIGEFGAELTLSRTTVGEFDEVEGRNYDETVATQIIKAVRVPVNQTAVDQLDIKYAGESLTVSQVIMLKVAAKGLTLIPAIGDSILLDGVSYPVVAMTPSNPAGIPLVYTVALKQ